MKTEDYLIVGYARAAKLTSEERKEIAQKAAKERWEPGLPNATHSGIIKIGDIKIPCAVLDNGKRVLTEFGITNALLGSRSGASKRIKKSQKNDGAPTPLFVAPNNIKSLISKELWEGPLTPIKYYDGKLSALALPPIRPPLRAYSLPVSKFSSTSPVAI